MFKRCAPFAVFVLACLVPSVAAGQSDLARARTLYNAGEFEDAIAAVGGARIKPAETASAALIAARARLELSRRTGDAGQLSDARAALVSLNPRSLSPQEAIEWQVGVGAALFLEEQPAAAADAFVAALPSARLLLTPAEFEKLFDWWGTATAKLAEGLTGDTRHQAYERLRADARLELERNPLSRPAIYWTVVAARGAGDLEAAWGAAAAGWIRAGEPPDGADLRADIDTFVTQTLIPERAQARTAQRLDAKATVDEIVAMKEEWRALTARWGR